MPTSPAIREAVRFIRTPKTDLRASLLGDDATQKAPSTVDALALHSRRLFAKYESALLSRPILTKAITSAVLYGAGDLIAQLIAARSAVAATSAPASAEIDPVRTLRAVVYGGAFYAPLAHAHYEFLDWLVVRRWRVSLNQVPLVKLVIEQFVYWSYLSNAYYHFVMGALQGQTPQACWDGVVATLWTTVRAQWVFWIPVQLLNFYLVPLRHQLNCVLVVSLIWTTFLSLAFPPE